MLEGIANSVEIMSGTYYNRRYLSQVLEERKEIQTGESKSKTGTRGDVTCRSCEASEMAKVE